MLKIWGGDMRDQGNSEMKSATIHATQQRTTIRSVRLQQNMMAKQLAARMGVSPARVSVMERDEQRGAVTLKMMQKAAEALGCEFVYSLVPKSGEQGRKRTHKVKIRLDSAHLKENAYRQVQELEHEYERSLRKNGKT